MGGIAQIIGVERATVDGVPVVNVIGDPGGAANTTYEHFTPPGVDAPPLPGVDALAYSDAEGEGQATASGYTDTKNVGKAAQGEHRIIGRSPDGTPVNEFWLKGDGSIRCTELASGKYFEFKDGKLTVDGEIVATGDISSDGEVTANASSTAVTLSKHKHTSGGSGSPTSPPLPG